MTNRHDRDDDKRIFQKVRSKYHDERLKKSDIVYMQYPKIGREYLARMRTSSQKIRKVKLFSALQSLLLTCSSMRGTGGERKRGVDSVGIVESSPEAFESPSGCRG